jgi:hypothetical protein
MYSISSEAAAWMRAADQTKELRLPQAVLEARANVERIEAELAELGPVIEVPPTHQLVADGTPLAEAGAEQERIAKEASEREAIREVGQAALYGAYNRLNAAVAAVRDELVGAATGIACKIVNEARPHAETLAPLGPRFSQGDLVHQGDAKMLKAFQAVAALERRFGMLAAAARESFKAEVIVPGAFDEREVPESSWYFEEPSLVKDDALAGVELNKRGMPKTISPDVLSLAREDGAVGFHFPRLREIAAAYEANRATWERMPAYERVFTARSV